MAEVLLMAGADVDAFGQYNPLILQAAFTNCTEMVRTMLQFGADANKQHDPQYTPLYFACHRSNFDMVQVLVSEGRADVTLASREQLTPLMASARVGNVKCVSYLLFHSSDNVNAKDALGKTALHYAAASGKIRVVRSLLKHGAVPFVSDSTYTTPFISAMMHHHKAIADSLRPKSIDERIEDTIKGHKNTMLVYAVRCGHYDTAHDLIGHGATVSGASSGNPYPIIYWALQRYDTQMVKLLAPHTDLSLPVEASSMNSIQYFAMQMFDPDSNSLKVKSGTEIMETLVNHGADVNAVMPNADVNENIIMHCVSPTHSGKVPFLLNIGADPNIVDGRGCTAMWYAFNSNNLILAHDLIMGNYDMGLTRLEGADDRTPMQKYIQSSETNTEMVVQMVSAGINLNNISKDIDNIVNSPHPSNSNSSLTLNTIVSQNDETDICSGSQREFNEPTPEFIGRCFIPVSSKAIEFHRHKYKA